MQRDSRIDIIRGLGIIAVVWGHFGLGGRDFIYAFHMPLFFFISGTLFRENFIEGWKGYLTFIKRKIKSLYIPWLVCGVIDILLHNIFYYIGVWKFWGFDDWNYCYSLAEIVKRIFQMITLQRGYSIVLTPIWFIRCLFLCNIVYYGVSWVILKFVKYKKWNCYIRMVLFIVLFLLGTSEMLNSLPMQISTLLVALFVFDMGVNAVTIMECLDKKCNILFSGCIVVVGIFLTYEVALYNSLDMESQRYPNVFYTFLGIIGGIGFTYALGKIINSSNVILVKNMLMRFGKESLWILILHVAVAYTCYGFLRINNIYNSSIYHLIIMVLALGMPVLVHNFIKWVGKTIHITNKG